MADREDEVRSDEDVDLAELDLLLLVQVRGGPEDDEQRVAVALQLWPLVRDDRVLDRELVQAELLGDGPELRVGGSEQADPGERRSASTGGVARCRPRSSASRFAGRRRTRRRRPCSPRRAPRRPPGAPPSRPRAASTGASRRGAGARRQQERGRDRRSAMRRRLVDASRSSKKTPSARMCARAAGTRGCPGTGAGGGASPDRAGARRSAGADRDRAGPRTRARHHGRLEVARPRDVAVRVAQEPAVAVPEQRRGGPRRGRPVRRPATCSSTMLPSPIPARHCTTDERVQEADEPYCTGK